MAQESLFASLDATALHGESNEIRSRPNSLARRSVSIFSRRGTETPEPKPPFIAQAAMQIPKQMNEKQKRWIKRKSAPAEVPTGPRGTVLNRVPLAKTITMTALEEEMATSPNEEILSAIGGTPKIEAKFEWPPSAEQADTLWNPNSIPLAQRSMSKRRKDTNSRIGVWRNGVTHWDEEARRDRTAAYGDPSLQEPTGFTPLRRVPTERLYSKSERPTLTVVIPSSELLISDSLSNLIQPTPQRVLAVAPTGVMPSFTLTSPAATIKQLQDEEMSPIDSPSTRNVSAPPLVKRPKVSMRSSTDSGNSSEKRTRKSSSSTLSNASDQDDSDDSRGTSATSLEIHSDSPVKRKKGKRVTFSPVSPSEYSPYCESPSSVRCDVDKPLPPTPTSTPPAPARAPPPPPVPQSTPAETKDMHRLVRKPVPQRKEQSTFSTIIDNEEGREGQNTRGGVPDPRPKEIFAPSDNEPNSIQRHGSVHRVLHPPERAPTIPKRSRKREWRDSQKATRAVHLSVRTARRRKSDSHIHLRKLERQPGLQRSPSATELVVVSDVAELLHTPIESLLPPMPTIVVEETSHEADSTQNDEDGTVAKQTPAAEDVLLRILSALVGTQDLFSAARINKGMYRVFKENEAHLIQSVTRNESPPAWEFREWSEPDNNSFDSIQSSTTFLAAYRRDLKAIESLKKLILERCQTVVRRETMFALSTPTHPNAARFNDAFWRIWCFCKIFGCKKGREEDVAGQLDWLKGGLLAHNQDLSATANVNLDFEMGSVLLNPPDFFAKGNGRGLGARQLYDMTEIWTCLRTLLEGYHARTEQAWDNGVYDECGIGPGDDEMEEQLLEEWTSYLLTLGPQVVLEMAEFADDTSSAGFALAKVNGWTRWSPPECGGSRGTFLKEPVARLYEERAMDAAERRQRSSEEDKKEMSRKRVATLAAEIKLARQSSTFKRLPFIDQANERPWSALSRRNSTMSSTSARSMASMSSMRRQISSSSRRNTTRVAPLTPMRYTGPPNFSVPRPRSPPFRRLISPIIENRVETFNRMSLQNFGSGIPEHTAERAVRRITDMGFCDRQAREALRMTDMGDGLRVDRAVDMLLRGEA